jgi:hypothetical protein
LRVGGVEETVLSSPLPWYSSTRVCMCSFDTH